LARRGADSFSRETNDVGILMRGEKPAPALVASNVSSFQVHFVLRAYARLRPRGELRRADLI
jgi:hypothetical protein